MSEISLHTDHPTDALPDYARGRADNPEAIERHLAECEACCVELEILRALADAPVAEMTAAEREYAYQRFAQRRRDTGGWLSATWKIAAAIALLLTGVGVWQVFKTGGDASDWNPQLVLDAWEEDLADLQPGVGEVQLALGFVSLDGEQFGVPWEEMEGIDPIDLAAPWEEDR
jgi:hypothetical protein